MGYITSLSFFELIFVAWLPAFVLSLIYCHLISQFLRERKFDIHFICCTFRIIFSLKFNGRGNGNDACLSSTEFTLSKVKEFCFVLINWDSRKEGQTRCCLLLFYKCFGHCKNLINVLTNRSLMIFELRCKIV